MDTEISLSLARLSAIVQSSQDAIISKLFDGTIISWNPAAERIFGYTAEEAIGKNITMIIPGDLLHEEREIISKVKSGELIEHYETIRKTKNGHKISIKLSVSPIRDNNGIITGISSIARDITSDIEAKKKEAILAAIIDSSDDAIISKTLNGFITSWNPAAKKMFGFTESEAVGKHISIIIPKDRIAEETLIIDNIRNGKKVDHFETVRVAKDGREIDISLTISPVKGKNGEIIGASKVARDITEKAEIERQRLLYTQKLHDLNNQKDEFMAMASHELKTPLTVVTANLQLLQLKLHDNTNIEFVDRSLNQVNKLSDLITNLLNISKLQTGMFEIEPAVFELGSLLTEATGALQQITSSHRIIYKKNEENFIVDADRKRIDQVIVNILSNAIKYSPQASDIIVDTFKEEGKIVVSIKDNGIGIPAQDLQNIFERYYRASGVNSTFSGSGIGLYISSEIIKQHGGNIWADSEKGKGSVFYFSLPLVG